MDELEEGAFLFGIHSCPNGELLRRVAGDKIHLLCAFSQLELEGRVLLSGGLLEGGHISRVNIVLIEFELLRIAS